MQVKFTDKAIAHLERILDVHLEYSGELSAIKFGKLVDEKLKDLTRFPYTGFPEPLLAKRKKLFRATILKSHYKMIYYVEDDVIWVAAFWDTRMNPDRLRRLI